MDNYRELKEENDLFFTCSLIEYISRKTCNTKRYVVNRLGLDLVEKIYNLADVYHCENLDKTTEEFVTAANIEVGDYDYKAGIKYKVPTEYEIGRVYQRLILNLSKERNQDLISVLVEVYNSWIVEKIDNYNSNMYYTNSDYIFGCYQDGKIIDE